MATVLNPNATDDEPLRISLEDEPAVAEAGEKAVPLAPPAPAPAPAAGIDELKRQLDLTARNRQEWQQHAQQMRNERDQQAQVATQAQERGILAEEVVNETKLKSVNDQFAATQEAQQAAYEAGQWDKVAEMNVKMNRLGGQVAVLEVHQQQLANNRQQYIANQQWQQQQRQNAATQQQQRPAAPADPVEAFIATRTKATQQFIRTHRDKIFRADGTLRQAAIDADGRAKDQGFKEDTDDYFRYVEGELTSGSQEAPRQRQNKNTTARPMTAPHTAAPVSRGGNVPGQISGSEFVMTPYMRELAQEQGVPPAEWAKEYVRLVREGRMDPIE